MNIGEAKNVNVLLRYFLDARTGWAKKPDAERALEAATDLGARAAKVLGAGISAEDLEALFASHYAEQLSPLGSGAAGLLRDVNRAGG